MNAAGILADLDAAGIRLEARADRLHFSAWRPVTPDERQMLAEHKADLLAQLAAQDALRAHLRALAAPAGIPAAVPAALPAGALAAWQGTSDAGLLVLLDYRHRTMIVRGELPADDDDADAATGAVIDVATPGAIGKLTMPTAAGSDP